MTKLIQPELITNIEVKFHHDYGLKIPLLVSIMS